MGRKKTAHGQKGKSWCIGGTYTVKKVTDFPVSWSRDVTQHTLPGWE
jgi:hypothetical protein